MTGYIMESDREAARITAKTAPVLVRRHLAWSGLTPGVSFLDVGCATGEVVAEVARRDPSARVVGLDASHDRLDLAVRACRRDGVTNVRTRCAVINEVGSSGLPDGAFDHAWTRFFLEYQTKPQATVDEMTRVVKPGGKVTLIDLEGNCAWHFGMPQALSSAMDEILADLALTGFDPHVGRKLPALASAAGLVDLRHEVEPYHRIVGSPDKATAHAWEVKIETIRDNYLRRLFPHKAHLAWVFDEFLDFILSPDTMTWSLLHLVQGRRSIG